MLYSQQNFLIFRKFSTVTVVYNGIQTYFNISLYQTDCSLTTASTSNTFIIHITIQIIMQYMHTVILLSSTYFLLSVFFILYFHLLIH